MTAGRFLFLFFLLTFALLALGACSDPGSPATGDQKDFKATDLSENSMLRFFADHHLGQTILKYAQADLDNDGRKDLIVIYQVGSGKNQMSVIHYQMEHFIETNAVPAPVSDQVIQLRNIDEKPPLEFILQGRKGAKVGYAIFRLEDGKLIDLFGDGMEDCC